LAGPRLLISEVVAANDTGARDPASPDCPEFDDWIELFNDGDEAAELEGVWLRDSTKGLALPDQVLEPGEHLLVWADNQPEQGPLHAPFRVAATGERLELMRDDQLLDAVDVPPIARDNSWARWGANKETWLEVSSPSPGEANQRQLPDDPCFAPKEGFDDHSYPCISSAESFTALAGDRTDLQVVKFDIFGFGEDDERVAYVDTAFYTLHDQFYLFTILNGQPFDGLIRFEPYPGSFLTWGELDAWARSVDLGATVDPYLATFVGERLVSRYFYDSVNGKHRSLGVGTLVHQPASPERDALWAFELEHGDDISFTPLVGYFEALEASGPPEFADLKWLVRSVEQEQLAQRMEAEGLAYADRIVRYSELAEPGEIQVYNPGLTAGRPRMIRFGEDGLENARSTDILVLDEIPDYLPPCAALITSVPQTPLSHISLLARSRGIPNLYVAGITADAQWDAWTRVSTRVALEATDEGMRAGIMTRDEYNQWRDLLEVEPPDLEAADPTSLAWTVDLDNGPGMLELRPQVGGKAAGMRQLLDTASVDTPDAPLALTVRAYAAHLDQFEWLPDMLEAYPFRSGNSRLRYLVLEGQDAYNERYPSQQDAETALGFLVENPSDTVLGALAWGAGLKGALASASLPEDASEALGQAVETQFLDIDNAQGIRFRSSSTVEDVEGFNGAGLYTSVTGYRAPEAGQRSVDQAVSEVWSSYWGAEAFEERRSAGIDHLDGAMGVLAHPRFDDEFELANAVLTISLLPDGSHELLTNAQAGSTPVANPPTTCPAVLPEQSRVLDATGQAVIERIAQSTEVPTDAFVLSDEQLLSLFEASVAIVDGWLGVENAELVDSRQRSILTLDIEVRSMGSGWPLGTNEPPRLVIKQSRSLEPSASGFSASIQSLPAPRDLLARAARIRRIDCIAPTLTTRLWTLTTDPLAFPDLGYSESPFAAGFQILADEAVPELGWSEGASQTWTHLDMTSFSVGDTSYELELTDGPVVMDSEAQIVLDGAEWTGAAECTAHVLWSSPDLFLEAFLD